MVNLNNIEMDKEKEKETYEQRNTFINKYSVEIEFPA
jgi:hypothetical protein